MKAVELANKLLDAAVQFGNLDVVGFNSVGGVDELDAVLHLYEADHLFVCGYGSAADIPRKELL